MFNFIKNRLGLENFKLVTQSLVSLRIEAQIREMSGDQSGAKALLQGECDLLAKIQTSENALKELRENGKMSLETSEAMLQINKDARRLYDLRNVDGLDPPFDKARTPLLGWKEEYRQFLSED